VEPGVTVTAASLSEDNTTVTLTTSRLATEVEYRLTITGVVDRAKTPNRIKPGASTFHFTESGNGLKAEYFDQLDFKGKTAERIDETIDFNWQGKAPAPGIAGTDFTVRWTGKLRVARGGRYTFTARTDDGVRVWVGGKRIINTWVHRSAADSAGRITLKAGPLYDIKVEYFQGGGDSVAQLFWQAKSIARQIVPQAHLYAW
jgi:hypothetical protein